MAARRPLFGPLGFGLVPIGPVSGVTSISKLYYMVSGRGRAEGARQVADRAAGGLRGTEGTVSGEHGVFLRDREAENKHN